MRVLVFAALVVLSGGYEHRYFIVNGPDHTQIGQHYFHRLVAEGTCARVERKTYPSERVVVNLCYV